MPTSPCSAPLVDAHAHLYAAAFDDDLDEVLARAAERGVQAVLCVSETVAEAHRVLELADRHPLIKPCAGLYPTILDRDAAADMLAFIRRHRDRLAAIGEVGLDYWKVQDAAGRELQRDILAQHVALSVELDLPLNVHSRSAGRHAIAWLQECGAQRVLLHAFDGKAATARAGVEAGYRFSVPPSIVRSPQKQKLVRHLPAGASAAGIGQPGPGSRQGRAQRALQRVAVVPRDRRHQERFHGSGRRGHHGQRPSPVPRRFPTIGPWA